MIPLYDKSLPLLGFPYVIAVLIVLNILVFIGALIVGDLVALVSRFGLIPSLIFKGQGLYTFLTCLFLHVSFWHLCGNMWFLWLFGNNIEDHLGKIKFVILFFVAGIVASLTHMITVGESLQNIPVIGASGAISGLLGAYVILFPHNKIRTFFMLLYRPLLFDLPAYFFIGVWFVMQFLYLMLPSAVAYTAHIGGFLTGLVFALIFGQDTQRKDYVAVEGELLENKV